MKSLRKLYRWPYAPPLMLLVLVSVNLARAPSPSCHENTPWWIWVLPFAVFAAMWVATVAVDRWRR